MSDENRRPEAENPEPAVDTAHWYDLPGDLLGEKPPRPLPRTAADRAFALGFYLVGYGYVRLVLDSGGRWQVGLFTLLYAAAVLAYLAVRGRRPPAFSWFWLAVLGSLGLSFLLWPNESLLGFDVLALHAAAVYWPLCAAGVTLRPCTSALLPADLLNGGVVLPFGNFFVQLRCVFGGWQLRKAGRGRQALAVLLGAALLALLVALVAPLLAAADAGFARLLEAARALLRMQVRVDALPLVLALPVGAYLFGLVYGAVHGRHTDHLTAEKLAAAGEKCRVVPTVTVHIVLAGICLVYAVFIVLQAGSLFSAFAGRLHGTEVYSQFAREGFFELCRVAAINGVVLVLANVLGKDGPCGSRAVRVWNAVLSGLTLLLLASAVSKMALYVSVYGLTARRVLTLAFMAMLAVVFGGTIVRQRKRFNLIRLALAFAAVLFCLLAVCNLDGLIAAYNAAHGFQ